MFLDVALVTPVQMPLCQLFIHSWGLLRWIEGLVGRSGKPSWRVGESSRNHSRNFRRAEKNHSAEFFYGCNCMLLVVEIVESGDGVLSLIPFIYSNISAYKSTVTSIDTHTLNTQSHPSIDVNISRTHLIYPCLWVSSSSFQSSVFFTVNCEKKINFVWDRIHLIGFAPGGGWFEHRWAFLTSPYLSTLTLWPVSNVIPVEATKSGQNLN